MTKKICFLLVVLLSLKGYAQTGIGTSTPHASAKLDVTSTNKGFLPPRVTLTAATDAVTIPSPAEGLLVYNLGSVGLQAGYYYWNGASWATWTQTDASGIAEFGEATITSTSTFTVTGTYDIVSFTLPSAGTWEVTYHVRGRTSTASNSGVAQISNNSNVEIESSRGMMGFSNTTASLDVSTTMTTRITTTGAGIYKLRVRYIPNGGTGSLIIFPTGEQFGGSKVVWKKISGFVPLSPVPLAYAHFRFDTHPTAVGDFTPIINTAEGITLSGTTITRQRAGTYLIKANLAVRSVFANYAWVNTSNTIITGTNFGIAAGGASVTTDLAPSAPATGIIVVAANTQIKLRLTGVNSANATNAIYSSAYITQLR